ncbi:hypothetical protein ES705_19843 [subsurface metagenome]
MDEKNELKKEAMSDEAKKFCEEFMKSIGEFDVCQQNIIIERMCKWIFQQRRDYLDKTQCERDEYIRHTENFIKLLKEIEQV